MSAAHVACLVIIFSVWTLANAMYYHSAEREEKCVIEDLPAELLVTGRYKIQKWDLGQHDFLPSAPGLGMVVTIKAPNSEILLSKLYGPDGKFTFTSHTPGEHTICMQSNSTNLIAFASNRLLSNLHLAGSKRALACKWGNSGVLHCCPICMQELFYFQPNRIHLDIQVGEHPLDYSAVDPKDKVKEVSNILENLQGEMSHIMKEQEYQREREEYYRQKSEDMNSNVLWWAIVQTIILTSVGIWQIKRLKDFLIAKKIV